MRSSCHHDGVAPFGDRRINACSRLPHAYRSYATSFIGTQRRGIHPLLILSSQQEDLVWTILDRLLHVVDSVDDATCAWSASLTTLLPTHSALGKVQLQVTAPPKRNRKLQECLHP